MNRRYQTLLFRLLLILISFSFASYGETTNLEHDRFVHQVGAGSPEAQRIFEDAPSVPRYLRHLPTELTDAYKNRKDGKGSFSILAHFLSPNETFPGEAVSLLNRAPKGVYLSVGTDRGFNNASSAPQVSHLLLVDYDPHVAYFNAINIWLLQVAKDREDYLHLRLKAGPEEWLERAREQGMDTASRRSLEKLVREIDSLDGRENRIDYSKNPVERAWQFWDGSVRKVSGFSSFHEGGGRDYNGRSIFTNSNYLREDGQFERIHRMAKEGKIQTHYGDFTDTTVTPQIEEALRKADLKLSVIDLSNSWWNKYTPDAKLRHNFETLQKVADPDAFVLVTDGSADDFHYAGASLRTLNRVPPGGLERAIRALRYSPAQSASVVQEAR